MLCWCQYPGKEISQNVIIDTMGKLFGKVLQRRLQELAEEVLSDSQYGFRGGRGCVDSGAVLEIFLSGFQTT